MAHSVVLASGACLELTRIRTLDFNDFLVDTLALTPRLRAKPPPLAPISNGSVRGLPTGSTLQISKKLDNPAGQAASDTGKDPHSTYLSADI